MKSFTQMRPFARVPRMFRRILLPLLTFCLVLLPLAEQSAWLRAAHEHSETKTTLAQASCHAREHVRTQAAHNSAKTAAAEKTTQSTLPFQLSYTCCAHLALMESIASWTPVLDVLRGVADFSSSARLQTRAEDIFRPPRQSS